VHQAGRVTGGADLGAGRQHLPHLVGEHCGGGVGVLERERATEAATLVGVGQRDQLEPAHPPQRRLADPQHPQRVAGRVVGDPVREVRADVLDAEHVDQQLRQLVRPGGHQLRPVGQRLVARPAGHIACWWRTEPTHEPDGATTVSYGSN
jgi:hypothetical protein